MTMLTKMDVLANRGQMKALPYIRQSLCDNLGVGGGGRMFEGSLYLTETPTETTRNKDIDGVMCALWNKLLSPEYVKPSHGKRQSRISELNFLFVLDIICYKYMCAPGNKIQSTK